MPKVVGVRFHGTGKAYHFDPLAFTLHQSDAVIVETVQGIELGIVSDEIIDLPEEKLVAPLKPILRVATAEDLEHYEENRKKEAEAFKIALEKIKARNLDMHLVDVEYTFDNRKVIFYFTADGRVDFRELVKDLAAVFRIRIELRQIGVRDEARMIGGLGICGRELCCCSFLNDFIPVSIKMAKEQSLSMNPAKISGCCGRLMCCLKYEQEAYEDAISRMPRPGHVVMTPEGQGTVEGINLLKETVTVRLDRGGEADLIIVANDLVEIIGGKPGKRCPPGGCAQATAATAAKTAADQGGNRRDRQKNKPEAASSLAMDPVDAEATAIFEHADNSESTERADIFDMTKDPDQGESNPASLDPGDAALADPDLPTPGGKIVEAATSAKSAGSGYALNQGSPRGPAHGSPYGAIQGSGSGSAHGSSQGGTSGSGRGAVPGQTGDRRPGNRDAGHRKTAGYETGNRPMQRDADFQDQARGRSRDLPRDPRSGQPNESRQNAKPDSRSESRDSRVESRDGKPAGKPEGRSFSRAGARQEGRPESRDSRVESRDGRPAGRPEGRSFSRDAARQDGRPGSRAGDRPDGQTGSRDAARPDGRPGSRAGNRPDGRPESRADASLDGRPESRADTLQDGRKNQRYERRPSSADNSFADKHPDPFLAVSLTADSSTDPANEAIDLLAEIILPDDGEPINPPSGPLT